MKNRRFVLSLILGIAICSVCLLTLRLSPSASGDALAPDGLTVEHQFDLLAVAVQTGDGWRDVGPLMYDKELSEGRIDLAAITLPDPVLVEVRHLGDTATHIDAVTLGDQAPGAVSGTSEDPALALKKVARRDNDLIDAQGKRIVFTFERPGDVAVLKLVARIEPERIPKTPFRFPPQNQGREMSRSAAFYSYELDSHRGVLSVDGDLTGEQLGKPFFRVFCEPTTGHPANYTYGWVRNDDEYLYVAIDFAADNTRDGDKDYAAVYVKTLDGVLRFEVSVPRQRWGSPGFEYTGAAVYEHKVYEFRIPLDELGMERAAADRSIDVAFEAYGTSAASANLEAHKSNNVGGATTPGTPFTWTVTISMTKPTCETQYGPEVLLSDKLPSGDISYGPVTVISRGVTSIPPTLTQALSCTVDTSDILVCRVTSGSSIDFCQSDAIDVSFQAVALASGTYGNPREVQGCVVQPNRRGGDSDRYCSDTVRVGAPIGGYTSPSIVARMVRYEPLLVATVLFWVLVAGAVLVKPG